MIGDFLLKRYIDWPIWTWTIINATLVSRIKYTTDLSYLLVLLCKLNKEVVPKTKTWININVPKFIWPLSNYKYVYIFVFFDIARYLRLTLDLVVPVLQGIGLHKNIVY